MKPSAERVLRVLELHQERGVMATRLCSPLIGGIDFRKRISELRKLGYTITPHAIPGRPYKRYRLEGVPA